MPESFRTVGKTRYRFKDLKTLLPKASPARSGDRLAGIAATTAEERVAAEMALADLPLKAFLAESVVDYEMDDIARLILDGHDRSAFAPVSHLCVGDFRNWLLSYEVDTAILADVAPGLTPEMVAGVSKIMRIQDMVLVASKIRGITRFRNTLGLPGRLSNRLQPTHPTYALPGIAASPIDRQLYGCSDAVLGINPATGNLQQVVRLNQMLADVISTYSIPTQSCILTHVTTTKQAMSQGAPVDLVFQSIGGTEATNRSFGATTGMLEEANAMARDLKRGTIGTNVMYFETGEGSSLSANAHLGVNQQTLEVRANGLARKFSPLLINSVVGLIGPECLDGREIIRAGIEDHFCGKLLGLPMGIDVCYTNHADANQDDMDTLLTLLGAAGVNYIMGAWDPMTSC